MWPLEPSSREYLRVGGKSIERWMGTASRLDCIASHPLLRRSHESMRSANWPELEAGLRTVYADKPRSAVTLLLESALMPALLLEAGPELWAPAQVQALLQHRLVALYGAPGEPPDAWDTRIDHLAGEQFTLGFGLRTSLKHTILSACASVGIDCRRLLPAFAWGLSRLNGAKELPERRGWLGWAEQDRLLLAHLESGRAVTLNAAARIATDSAAIVRQVETERVRCGLAQSGPIVATRWSNASHDAGMATRTIGQAVTWIDIGHGTGANVRGPAASTMASQP